MGSDDHKIIHLANDRGEREVAVISVPLPNGKYVDPNQGLVLVVQSMAERANDQPKACTPAVGDKHTGLAHARSHHLRELDVATSRRARLRLDDISDDFLGGLLPAAVQGLKLFDESKRDATTQVVPLAAKRAYCLRCANFHRDAISVRDRCAATITLEESPVRRLLAL